MGRGQRYTLETDVNINYRWGQKYAGQDGSRCTHVGGWVEIHSSGCWFGFKGEGEGKCTQEASIQGHRCTWRDGGRGTYNGVESIVHRVG